MPEDDSTPANFDSDDLLHSTIYEDTYFSTSGAEAESEHVFIDGNQLKERFKGSTTFSIAEAGFGTGLNFTKTTAEWEKHFSPEKKLIYTAFEAHPLTPSTLTRAHSNWPALNKYSQLLLKAYTSTPATATEYKIPELNITLNLIIGDINTTIKSLTSKINAWFLDGFSPSKNPQMWTGTLFKYMASTGIPNNTTFATYSCARVVRDGLTQNNFEISKVPGYGKKKHMLVGALR